MPGQNLIFPAYAEGVAVPDDAEKIVATLIGVSTIYDGQPVYLHGWVNTKADADATALVLRIRRNDLDGDSVIEPVTFGAPVDVGGDPIFFGGDIYGMDTPGNAQNATYVLTVTFDDAGAEAGDTTAYLEARVG